ncbi:hypothetical protein PM082_018748 [Marasmius tenuissimus]|nr:hypothetical protein PM082_018748 [Marasmius tenuissimus]
MKSFVSFGVALLSLAASANAAPQQSKRQSAQVFYTCAQPNTVAITFDDGPWEYIYDISKTLTDNGAKATFFFSKSGGCIYDQEHMDQVKFAYQQGHQVGSHTWRHADLATLSADEVNDEMQRVEQALQRIVGVVPAFMRPPYGSFNQNVQDVAGARGQSLVIWDFDAGDANGVPPAETLQDYNTTIAKHPNTLLPLNHETYATRLSLQSFKS